MTWTDIPYRNCCSCENIEDCPHPDVNDEGHPIPPSECCKPDEIKLTQKTDES